MGRRNYKRFVSAPWNEFRHLNVASELTIEPQKLTESDLSGNFLDFVETEMAKTPFKVLAYRLPEGVQYFNLPLYHTAEGFSDYVYNQQTIIYEKQKKGKIYRNVGPEKEKLKGHSAKSILSSGNSNFCLNGDTVSVSKYNKKMKQILKSGKPMKYGVGGELDLKTFEGDKFKNWNLRTLDNPLRDAEQMPGINIPGAILSPQGTITAMHTEDHDLMSINMMVLSEYENPEKVEIKEWLVIVPSKKNLRRLKKLLNKGIYKFEKQDFKSRVSKNKKLPQYCKAAYRKKRFAVTMKTLHKYGVEFRRLKQTPGVIVITSENLFHQILNVTKNRTYSVNCMSKSWRSKNVRLCKCAHTGKGFERRHGQIIPCFTTDKLIDGFSSRRLLTAPFPEDIAESDAGSSNMDGPESQPDDVQQTSTSLKFREKTVPCDLCDCKFYNTSAKNQHVKGLHSEKMFQCSVCEMMFARNAQLSIHFRSMHLQAEDYICDKCGRSFRHYSSKRDHVCFLPTVN